MGKMNRILRCDCLPERARWRYIAHSGLLAVSRKKIVSPFHKVDPLLTNNGAQMSLGRFQESFQIGVLYSRQNHYDPGSTLTPPPPRTPPSFPTQGRKAPSKHWHLFSLVNVCPTLPVQHCLGEGGREGEVRVDFYRIAFTVPTLSTHIEACSVKMAGYWPRSFLRVCLSVHKHAKKKKKKNWPISSHLDIKISQ